MSNNKKQLGFKFWNNNINSKTIFTYGLGNLRSTIGSASRTYKHCKQETSNPLECTFNIHSKIKVNTTPRTKKTAPSAPYIESIIFGNHELLVYFIKPTDNGGSPIIDYEYSIDNGINFVRFGGLVSPIRITNLTNGFTYNILIRAINLLGKSEVSNIMSNTPSTVPNGPNIYAIINGNCKLDIYFMEPTDNGGNSIINYEYSIDNGETFYSSETSISPIIITNLTNGIMYDIIIRPLNTNGAGENSNTVTGMPCNIPNLPTNITSIYGNNQLTISFTAPSDNGGSQITDYEYSIDNGITFKSSGVTNSPIIIPNLVNGTTYDIIVRAINSIGFGENSILISGTPMTKSTPPTNLTVTASNESIIVNFTEPVNNGGSNIIDYLYSINGSTYISSGYSSSPITINSLTNNLAYNITLKSVNEVGSSVASLSVLATPVEPIIPFDGDAIIASLTTSLSDYNDALNGEWVKITSSEYSNLKTNVASTNVAGLTDTYMSLVNASGLTTTDQSAIVANTVTANTPAILSNNYVYAFSVIYGGTSSGTDLRVFTNTSITSFTGFNQLGSVLPTTSSGSGYISNYYVLKGVSTTNGSTNGLLSIFTGETTKSGDYLGFYQNFSFTNGMRYNLYGIPAVGSGSPTSSTVLGGNIDRYGAFGIQALTTSIKQWN
uniref:Fibronectin type-III domain-containing protein n=1 Tax=viral metagenome TaxID=1070528 RepID=A0A6C0IR39_9ZZZZ